MVEAAAFTAIAEFEGEGERVEKSDRAGAECEDEGFEEIEGADIQDHSGFGLFGQIVGVYQFLVPAAEGEAVDVVALGFEGADFAADEALTGLGVLVDEVGDFHGG
jgi:hypothetical protein